VITSSVQEQACRPLQEHKTSIDPEEPSILKGKKMNRFKDMSVRAKLILLLGVFIGGMMLFGGVAYTALETVKIGSDLYNRIEASMDLQNDFSPPDASLQPAAFLMHRILLSHDAGQTQSYIQKFRETEKTFDERRQHWMMTLPRGRTKDMMSRAYTSTTQYFSVANDEVIPLVKAGKVSEAIQIHSAKMEPIYRQFEQSMPEIVSLSEQDTSAIKAAAQSTISARVATMFTVLIVCVALAGCIGWFIARMISAGLHEKVELLKNVASGDLTQRVEVDSKDEIGQLGQVVNDMTESLAAMIEEIRTNSQTLTSAAEALTSTSQQLGATSQETSTQANAVSAAAEEVSQNVATVSTATEEMTASIKEIAKNATDAASVAGNAARLASSTNTTMTKLSESSAQIGNVIKVITSIAEQTNLLALNATIEAARAGEAGKGFAVVANEVKELAKETAKATEDIGQRVEAIQIDAKGAVSAIDEITAVIGKINDIQNTIASSVEEQTAATNEIARNVSETAKGSTEIASNITGVAQAALETQQTATSAQQAAGDLSQLAHRLQEVVSHFRVSSERGTRPRVAASLKIRDTVKSRVLRALGAEA
jgi:methyl-accepting chemotaxis protein